MLPLTSVATMSPSRRSDIGVVGAEVAEAAVVVAACHCAAALPFVGEAEGVAVVVDVQPTRSPSKVRSLSVTVTGMRTSRSRRPNPSRRMSPTRRALS
jgi:hypothetical protein